MMDEYRRRSRERAEIISENRARRMRRGPKLPPLPVPPKPMPPMVPIAYAADGTYEGRLDSADECPAGCVVKWEPAKY